MENLTSEKITGGSFLLAPIGSQPQFIPENLSDEARAIGEAARDFMLGEVVPVSDAIDNFDVDLMKDLIYKAGEIGLLGIEIPEAYEGMDLDKKTALVLVEEIGRQPSFSITYSAHTGIGTLPIVYFGTEAQKAKYLPSLGSGQKIAAYALTEAESGTDAMSIKTSAVLDGDHWVVNGNKAWITNASFADIFIIFAKTDGSQMSAFIIERGDVGFCIEPEEKKLGLKGSSTCALSFNNCRIPQDRLLGQLGRGHNIAFSILAMGRFKLGAGCNGTAKSVLKYTAKYTDERHQFGKPLHAFGLIRQKLADMATKIFVAEAMNFRTVAYIDDRVKVIDWSNPNASKLKSDVINEFTTEASIAKIWGTEALFNIADDAVQCFGGYGFSTEYPPEKIYRDNRINRIFEGTNEINRIIIATSLYKKANNGTMVLPMHTNDIPELKNFTGLMAGAKHAVELAKRMCCYTVAKALEIQGNKLVDNQEASARVADMLIEIYAMECAVVRASLMTDANHHWAKLGRDLANAYVNNVWHKTQTNAIMLLSEVLDDQNLDKALADLNSFSKFVPQSSSKLRDTIAQKIIDCGAYPIAQY
jgi:alkylation response protein AidB-like acyl-CoA dehydrogenase